MAIISTFNQISSYGAFINKEGCGIQELELRGGKNQPTKKKTPSPITKPHTKYFTTGGGEEWNISQPILQAGQSLRLAFQHQQPCTQLKRTY